MLLQIDTSAFRIERNSVVLGLSTLAHLSIHVLRQRPEIRIALPDDLIHLLEMANEGSAEHMRFLRSIVNEFSESDSKLDQRELTTTLYSAYSFLLESGSLIILNNTEISEDVYFQLDGAFQEDRYFISLSPRDNFVKNYYLKALSWAERTGALVIENSVYFFKKVGHQIATLQIPDRVEQVIEAKKKHIDRVFRFKGGTATKWFIATVSGTLGFVHPLFGVPGLLITYGDP